MTRGAMLVIMLDSYDAMQCVKVMFMPSTKDLKKYDIANGIRLNRWINRILTESTKMFTLDSAYYIIQDLS